ncbi:MAG: hypothetical protein RMY36_030835 [Nostoc sp. SerVER01]|nr:hypothetical protein [Nostoc sp. SerVER01]
MNKSIFAIAICLLANTPISLAQDALQPTQYQEIRVVQKATPTKCRGCGRRQSTRPVLIRSNYEPNPKV